MDSMELLVDTDFGIAGEFFRDSSACRCFGVIRRTNLSSTAVKVNGFRNSSSVSGVSSGSTSSTSVDSSSYVSLFVLSKFHGRDHFFFGGDLSRSCRSGDDLVSDLRFVSVSVNNMYIFAFVY